MKTTLLLAAACGLASVAGAQKGAQNRPLLNGAEPTAPVPNVNVFTPPVINSVTTGSVTTVVVDIAGVESWDAQGDPSNTVLTVPLAAGDMMTGIGWDVTITTVGGSWLSEATMYFDGSDQDGSGLFLTPGAGNSAPGSMFFSSGGIIDLTDNGIPDIPILADGNLYIEFFESFDDADDAVDAVYDAPSTLTIEVLTGGGGGVPTVNQWGLIVLTTALFAGVVWRSARRKAAPQA